MARKVQRIFTDSYRERPKAKPEYPCPSCGRPLTNGEPGTLWCVCGKEFYWERSKTEFCEIDRKTEPLIQGWLS